ncbi:MAG TPA: PIN domain-containing protein [Thermoanaerobaculia bacterium]|nr:PIN domain-containing protein [Thermoanaerobaculia bacterium]
MPTKAVFLDTNGWLALLNSADALHSTATACWFDLIRSGTSVLLTDWIVAETGNGLARTRARERFAEAVKLIQASTSARLVAMEPSLLERALALYNERKDKTWGLVDCASFLVMREVGVLEAFTNDRHFAQAGFKCLLPIL